ncbi:MAG TPA: DUF3536 domain-containing protein, partial [Thermoanaerobaculia bacterium]|nr:DUF3536 domain-containing protein [Thermoanaerobaculia bacterium]
IATDGESYGHHHRYGEMAMAFAVDTIEARGSARMTNYPEFLSMYPPQDEVEIIEASSWSCSHGIERWRGDCGCRTGGDPSWNQAWRAPLRKALDWLRESLQPAFEHGARAMLKDPWAARNDYIRVVLDRSPEAIESFLAEHALRPLQPEEVVRALQLLEMQRYAMLMYTSCGWFFNEASGIETVQVLQYAARAIQLAREAGEVDLETEFLVHLEDVHSNIAAVGDGRAIFEAEVRPAMLDLPRVAAHYAVSSLFQEYAPSSRIYSYAVDREDQMLLESGRPQVVVGRLRVESIVTREAKRFSYGILHLGELNLSGGVREFSGDDAYVKLCEDLAEPFHQGDFPAVIRLLDQELGSLTFSVKSLFGDEQRRIVAATWSASLEQADTVARELYDRYIPLMRFHGELGIPLPRILRVAVEFAFNMHLRRVLERPNPPVAQVRSIVKEIRGHGIELDEATLSYVIGRRIEEAVRDLAGAPASVAHLKKLDVLLEIASLLPFPIDIWNAQNVYYRLFQTIMPQYLDRTGNGEEQARIWLKYFRSIGNRLAVREE